MTQVPDDIWVALEGGEVEVRQRAARRLGEYASGEDLDRIRRLRVQEPEVLVQRLLARAEDRATPGITIQPEGRDPVATAQRDATRSMVGLFLHELRPMIGRLDLALEAGSPECHQVAAIQIVGEIRRFLDAAARLQEASADPVRVEFDLTATTQSVIVEVLADFRARPDGELMAAVPVVPARDDHVVVSGDPEFVRLAIVNGLRNAIEACAPVDDSDGVVVNWGETDRDQWVSIIDDGEGLPRRSGDLFQPTQSTKRGSNLGMGLSVARAAMEGLGGHVVLVPREPRGTRFEIRWPLAMS